MLTTIEFQTRMDMLSEYMSQHNCPKELRERANRFCFYTFEVKKAGKNMEEDVNEMLSPPMKRDVAFHIYGKVLRSVPMFGSGEQSFIKDTANLLFTTTYGRWRAGRGAMGEGIR